MRYGLVIGSEASMATAMMPEDIGELVTMVFFDIADDPHGPKKVMSLL